MTTAKLTAAQRRHLISSYARICNVLRQMEDAARDGRSPTGLGAPLTPLSEKRAEPVLAPLRDLRDQLRQFALRLAPEDLRAFETPQSQDNTLVWLSNLLEEARQSAHGLQPSDMRNYGPLSRAAREALSRLQRELTERIECARRKLDGS